MRQKPIILAQRNDRSKRTNGYDELKTEKNQSTQRSLNIKFLINE